MNDRTTDFGALPLRPVSVNPDGTPVMKQAQTGRKVELRLIDQKSGHARHAHNTDSTLLSAMFNRGMLGDADGIGQKLLAAGEQIQEDFEATGNRQPMGASYSPVQASGDVPETEAERAASLRYHACIDQLTTWEWRLVRGVCIDDRMVDGLDLPHLVSGLRKLSQYLGK